MKMIAAILLLISIGCASAASAGDLDDGRAASEEGNSESSFDAWGKASNWSKAAEQGDAHAQYKLGLMYFHGQGVMKDYVQALKWFNVAAASGYEDAIKNRDTVASEMTPAQIAEAQKLASEWKPSSP